MELAPFSVYATAAVLRSLRSHDALCRTLERRAGQTRWWELSTGNEVPLLAADGTATGLTIEAVPVPGKLPPHLVGLVEPSPEGDVALLVRGKKDGFTLGYAPCVGGDAIGVARVLREANVVLFDGTFWSSDELVALGAGERTAEDMAHWKLSGEGGSLPRLRAGARGRVLLTHVNNTNPILRDGPERRAVLATGIGIADDGLELEA
jgi:pyrroloquinoline quinone biosynthesis protein B